MRLKEALKWPLSTFIQETCGNPKYHYDALKVLHYSWLPCNSRPAERFYLQHLFRPSPQSTRMRPHFTDPARLEQNHCSWKVQGTQLVLQNNLTSTIEKYASDLRWSEVYYCCACKSKESWISSVISLIVNYEHSSNVVGKCLSLDQLMNDASRRLSFNANHFTWRVLTPLQTQTLTVTGRKI